MSDTTDALSHLGRILRDNWHWLSGAAVALWYGLLRLKRTVFKDYVTGAQMQVCKSEIIDKVLALQTDNEKLMRELQQDNAQQHMDITAMIISAMRDRDA